MKRNKKTLNENIGAIVGGIKSLATNPIIWSIISNAAGPALNLMTSKIEEKRMELMNKLEAERKKQLIRKALLGAGAIGAAGTTIGLLNKMRTNKELQRGQQLYDIAKRKVINSLKYLPQLD